MQNCGIQGKLPERYAVGFDLQDFYFVSDQQALQTKPARLTGRLAYLSKNFLIAAP
jgi:hypothetical protein